MKGKDLHLRLLYTAKLSLTMEGQIKCFPDKVKLKEEAKAMQSEIKKIIQGTNSEGKETWTQINNLEQKGKINTRLEQNEEARIQKNEERLRKLQDNFKCSNIRIIGVPEGEEEEHEVVNLFEQIMKENFPIWQRK